MIFKNKLCFWVPKIFKNNIFIYIGKVSVLRWNTRDKIYLSNYRGLADMMGFTHKKRDQDIIETYNREFNL